MASRIRAFAWETTPLGPIAGWPQSLRNATDFILSSGFPKVIQWGADLIQIYNDASARLMGAKHPGGLGQPTRECWAEAWHISEPIYRRVLAGETLTFEDKHFRLARHCDPEDAWFTVSYGPLKDQTGGIAGAVVTVIETTARHLAEAALRKSEERYRRLVEQTTDGIFLATPDGRYADVNPAGCEMLGRTREEVLASSFLDVLHPEDHSRLPAQIAALSDGLVRINEWRFMRKDGTTFVGELVGRCLPDGHFQGVLRDITERKKAEERTQLLLREVNHRSKNMLTLVLAIASQTMASGQDDFLDRFSDRIEALAASQDLLVKSQWRGVGLGDLVRSQLAHFEDSIGYRIDVNGPPLTLPVPAAQPLGMALHELYTNAGKYGALSTDEGCVEIAWRIEQADGEEAVFDMVWRERGGPPAETPSRRGFGSYVISELIERSLDGRVELDFNGSGFTWRLRCPANAIMDENSQDSPPSG